MSLGKGGSPSPPTPPDPTQVSQQQLQASIDAARAQQGLNAVDQNNPWGSISYAIDPTTGRLTQNTNLAPGAQSQLRNQQTGGSLASGMGLMGLAGTRGNYTSPFSVGGANPITTGVQGGPIQSSLGNYGSVSNNAGQYQTHLPQGNIPLNTGANVGNVTGGSAYKFNTSGMPNLNQDYGRQFDEVSQSVLNAQMPVLDRLQQRQQSQLDAKLAGQGFTQGAAGYTSEQQRLAQSQGEAYNQLAAQAYGQGLQTQGQLFGENLGARSQLFGEQATQAQNAMQASQLNQQASAANAQNQLSRAGLQNSAQAQQFQEGLAGGQFHNQALGQQFGQNLSAQNQAYQQALGSGLFGLGAQQQQFGQGMQNAGLGNQANQQQIQNMITQRQYPIQEAGQLLGFGGGAQMPQFGSVPQAGVQTPNYGQFAYNNLAAQQDVYNQQQAGRNSSQSGLFGLGAGIAGALPWGSWFGGG